MSCQRVLLTVVLLLVNQLRMKLSYVAISAVGTAVTYWNSDQEDGDTNAEDDACLPGASAPADIGGYSIGDVVQ